jgi:hypothetical protein
MVRHVAAKYFFSPDARLMPETWSTGMQVLSQDAFR